MGKVGGGARTVSWSQGLSDKTAQGPGTLRVFMIIRCTAGGAASSVIWRVISGWHLDRNLSFGSRALLQRAWPTVNYWCFMSRSGEQCYLVVYYGAIGFLLPPPPTKRRSFYKQFEKIAATKLHIAARAKGSVPHDFRGCVMYAITGTTPSVSDFKQRRVVITAFCSPNIVSELKWLILVSSLQTVIKLEWKWPNFMLLAVKLLKSAFSIT